MEGQIAKNQETEENKQCQGRWWKLLRKKKEEAKKKSQKGTLELQGAI